MNARKTLCTNEKNHLCIGGADAISLVEKFGSPLYVMDEDYVRAVCRSFFKALNENYGKGSISYASKAFCTQAIYKIVASEGLSADVVSAGEMYTALSAGFDPEKLYFHGNNKLESEQCRNTGSDNIGKQDLRSCNCTCVCMDTHRRK